jgi:hypothetical protein
MKLIIAALIFSLCLNSTALAQKRKSVRSRKRTGAPARKQAGAEDTSSAPRRLSQNIVITLKDGSQIAGELLELNDQSARVRVGETETTVVLDTVSSLSFTASPAAPQQQPTSPPRADFLRDVEAVLNLLQAMADGTKAGTSYTDYGNQLVELRRAVERFVAKYSASENNSEARAVALVAGALTDYSWARTIWTLKLGYSGTASVAESDSPVVADALRNYPDLRPAAAAGDRFLVDKLVSGLWKKAAEKVKSLRQVVGWSR